MHSSFKLSLRPIPTQRWADQAGYGVDSRSPVCTVSGEIELDTSLFRNLAYSIGIAFSTPRLSGKPSNGATKTPPTPP